MALDFQQLHQQIKAAAQQAFIDIYQQYAAEEIYAFALYSDDGAMTVCPATNSKAALLAVDPDDYCYYQFEPAEWRFEMQGAEDQFDDLSTQLRTNVDALDNEAFEIFRAKLFECCISVLEELRDEKFFQNYIEQDIFLYFTASDHPFENQQLADIVNRLNQNHYQTEYLEWMQSWAS